MREEMTHINLQFIDFGANDAFTQVLVNRLINGEAHIQHPCTFKADGNNIEALFYVNKTKDTNLYSLDKFDLSVSNSHHQTKETFYLTGQDHVQLKEGEKKLRHVNQFTLLKAYNYLAGRPVFNAFSDKEGNQFEAWATRKFNVQKGAFDMVKYRKDYPFDPGTAVSHYGIKELTQSFPKERLMDGYKQGDMQLVTFVGHHGREEQLYTSLQIGLVKEGSLNVYDSHRQRVAENILVEKGFIAKDFAQKINERLVRRNEIHTAAQRLGNKQKLS